MTDTMLDNRKVEVAARINVEADRIKTVQLQLNVLRNQGILVDLSVSGTGMFTRTATWAEIGIQVDEAERDTNQVVKHLQEIAELEHQAVIDLMAGPSRFGMIEL